MNEENTFYMVCLACGKAGPVDTADRKRVRQEEGGIRIMTNCKCSSCQKTFSTGFLLPGTSASSQSSGRIEVNGNVHNSNIVTEENNTVTGAFTINYVGGKAVSATTNTVTIPVVETCWIFDAS